MNVKEKFASFVEKYDALLIFLILETLALLSFGLADANIIYRYLGFIIALALIPFAVLFVNKKETISLILFSIPLIVVSLLTSYSTFTIKTMNYGFLDNTSVFLGSLAFFVLGFVVRKINKFKIENVLLTIGGAIALIVLISLFYSLFRYGFFHTAIYKGLVYYYDGHLYVISNETKWLLGFEMKETLINYANFYGALLVAALPGLLFISPKTDLRKFLLVAFIGVVGLLSIIFVPNTSALLMLVPVVGFALIHRFVKKKDKMQKAVKYISIVFLALGGLALFVVMLNNLNIPTLHNLIANNRFLDRIFNTNRIISPINEVLKATFSRGGLFGLSRAHIDGLLSRTGAFEFEIIKEGGIFAFIALVIFLVFVIVSIWKYLKNSLDKPFVKVIIVSFLIIVMFYGSFLWTPFPFVHDSGIYVSFFRSNIYLLALFFIGFTFHPLWELKRIKCEEKPLPDIEVQEGRKEIEL